MKGVRAVAGGEATSRISKEGERFTISNQIDSKRGKKSRDLAYGLFGNVRHLCRVRPPDGSGGLNPRVRLSQYSC